MTLKEFIDKEGDFSKFGTGNWEDISLRDKDDETIGIYALSDIANIKEDYLNADFMAVGSSTIKPTRLRIRINYDI